MLTLLHIDSSPLYSRSVSRELTAAFVTQWEASHPDGSVIDRDLNATAMPPINAEWVGAVYTPEQARTSQQKELLSLSDSLLAELEQADEYVIGVPMHNFGVPPCSSYGSTRLRVSAGPFPTATEGRRA
jgi:FMN-dependent NADH-azoreductase